MKNKMRAIPIAVPASPVKPKTPAIKAMIRKISVQPNICSPFLFVDNSNSNNFSIAGRVPRRDGRTGTMIIRALPNPRVRTSCKTPDSPKNLNCN